MKIVNKLLQNFCTECHFDMLPFRERRPNLLLLPSSTTGMHSGAPFFTPAAMVTSFPSFVPRQFSLNKYEIVPSLDVSLVTAQNISLNFPFLDVSLATA